MPRDADDATKAAFTKAIHHGGLGRVGQTPSVCRSLLHITSAAVAGNGARLTRSPRRAIPLLSNWANRALQSLQRAAFAIWALVSWGGLTMAMKRILAVYHTCPVMIVAETAEDTIVELSLNELAEVYECLPPPLWQALVQQYHVFQVR